MLRISSLAIALLVSACAAETLFDSIEGSVSADESAVDPRLYGVWVVQDPVFACLSGYAFQRDGAYAAIASCVSKTGSVTGVSSGFGEVEGGIFSVSGERLTLDPARSSCPFKAATRTVGFQVGNDTLSITTPAGLTVHQYFGDFPDDPEVDPMQTGLQAEFGCVDLRTGRFTPGSIVDVP
jgi:hypothetical protein